MKQFLKNAAKRVGTKVLAKTVPQSFQTRFDVRYHPEWDFLVDRSGYPTDGPFKGTMYRYTVQIGPLVFFRLRHDSDESYSQAVQQIQRDLQQKAVEDEDRIIREHLAKSQYAKFL